MVVAVYTIFFKTGGGLGLTSCVCQPNWSRIVDSCVHKKRFSFLCQCQILGNLPASSPTDAEVAINCNCFSEETNCLNRQSDYTIAFLLYLMHSNDNLFRDLLLFLDLMFIFSFFIPLPKMLQLHILGQRQSRNFFRETTATW